MIIVAVVAFITSALGVGVARRYALVTAMMDVPNARSSHRTATPRGGGIGLVSAFLLSLALAQLLGVQSREMTLLMGGVAITAAVGWVDDRWSVGVAARLVCHCLAGLVLVMSMASDVGIEVLLKVPAVLWVLGTVTAINVVNFMDGIDGLVGSQVMLFGVHLALQGADGGASFVWGVAVAAACAGFLIWNWPPARIFLGDSGSGALGFAAIAGGVLVLHADEAPFLKVFLPLLPLFLDASVTLLRRALRGERLWQAHRTHLYQRLANGTWGHSRVTAAYAVCAGAGVAVARLDGFAWQMGLPLYVAGVLCIGFVLERMVRAWV